MPPVHFRPKATRSAIDDDTGDASLARCGRYVERNPVRAKETDLAWEWPFSSAGFYGLGKADGLTDPDVRV